MLSEFLHRVYFAHSLGLDKFLAEFNPSPQNVYTLPNSNTHKKSDTRRSHG